MRSLLRRRWSVKEWWELSPAEFEAAKAAAPPGQGIATGGSVVHHAHRTVFGASLELRRRLRRPSEYTNAKIVDHDEEMRRWGRHDFVLHPSIDDLANATEQRSGVIPSIAPGESVVVDLGSRNDEDGDLQGTTPALSAHELATVARFGLDKP